MKKIFSLFAALTLSVGLFAKTSIITYTATEKLSEAHSTYEAGVHFNAFDKDTISHIYDPITQTGTITFDGELTEIGDNAFYNIKKPLLSVEIPATVTKIGEKAFNNNNALTSINLPEGLTEIGDGAFYYCESLKSVILPSTLTTIGTYAFRGCSALETIHIPASVVSFGSEVFVRCSALKSITVDSENPILSAVDGVLYSHNQDTLYIFPAADALERTEFTTPETVTYVGAGAFFKNKKLTSITFGNSVLKLGEDIIDGANALTVLKIGSSVTELESYCLENTIELDSVICYAVTPPTCGTFAVFSMHSGTNIYVPNSSVEAYKAADEWSSRADYIFPLTSLTGLIKVDNAPCTMHDGKFMRNGQLIIRKENKTYNPLGAEL